MFSRENTRLTNQSGLTGKLLKAQDSYLTTIDSIFKQSPAEIFGWTFLILWLSLLSPSLSLNWFFITVILNYSIVKYWN